MGEPKSAYGLKIDMLTFMKINNDALSKMIKEQGNIIDGLEPGEYHVALSFAGENRKYVEDVAKDLRNKNIKVFYDEFEKN